MPYSKETINMQVPNLLPNVIGMNLSIFKPHVFGSLGGLRIPNLLSND